jgi:hypothetical protein
MAVTAWEPIHRAASTSPSWLRVKTRLKAGAEPKDDGKGAASTPPSSLKVKSQLKAGGKEMERGATQSNPPTWLGVKTRIKAGSKGFDLGPNHDEAPSKTLDRLTGAVKHAAAKTTPPSWLKVKSALRAGADKPGADFSLACGSNSRVLERSMVSAMHVTAEGVPL